MFMRRRLKLRLKTRLRFSTIWSLNSRKRSSPSPRISVRHSPIIEVRSAEVVRGDRSSPLRARLQRASGIVTRRDNSPLSKTQRAEEAP